MKIVILMKLIARVFGGGQFFNWSFTPLTWAAAEGNLPLVQCLVSQGADIDVIESI